MKAENTALVPVFSQRTVSLTYLSIHHTCNYIRVTMRHDIKLKFQFSNSIKCFQ